ncbi:YARHG domain-containing protein [Aquimarina sp. 2201CG1-2-11]|uniref:YARHG domain-containing protein n=1 Tax=Aquimarina discodermiae TaxID=3231043 RepID=UPI003461B305
MKKIVQSTFFIIISIASGFSQTKDTIFNAYVSVRTEEVNFSSLKKIENTKIYDYEGVYYFGGSESESELKIIYSNGKLFACSKYYDWEIDNWVLKNQRESIKYENEKLYVSNTPYQLYKYIDDANVLLKKGDKGLASFYNEIENEKTHHYLQFNYHSTIKKPLGKYPETSFVKLTSLDLEGFSAKELKVMRNEIFARKGYIFKQGGEMQNYFLQKDWYQSLEKTTNPNLNNIEKHNVNLIRSFESK